MADFAPLDASRACRRQLDRLSSLSPAGDRLGLARIAALLDRLGRRRTRFPRCSMSPGPTARARPAPSSARRSKPPATRPHVHQPASGALQRAHPDRRQADRGRAARRALDEVIGAGDGIEPSFFEVTTAAAFLAFARTPADACILEVGLGGRLDATNVIDAAGWLRNRPASASTIRIFSATRLIDIARRESRHRQARRSAGHPRYPTPVAERIATTCRGGWRAMAAALAEPGTCGVDRRPAAYRDVPARRCCRCPASPAATGRGTRSRRRHASPPGCSWSTSDEALANGIGSRAMGRAAAPAWRWARHRRLAPGGGRLGRRRSTMASAPPRPIARAMAGACSRFDVIFALSANRRVAGVLGPVAPLIRKRAYGAAVGHSHHVPARSP